MPERMSRQSFFQSFVYSKLFLLLGGLALVFVGVAILKGFAQRVQVKNDVQRLHEEIAALEKTNQDLESILQYLQSVDFVKQEGRAKFGLRERGEQVVVLHDTAELARTIPAQAHPQSALTNPQRWYNYFFAR